MVKNTVCHTIHKRGHATKLSLHFRIYILHVVGLYLQMNGSSKSQIIIKFIECAAGKCFLVSRPEG